MMNDESIDRRRFVDFRNRRHQAQFQKLELLAGFLQESQDDAVGRGHDQDTEEQMQTVPGVEQPVGLLVDDRRDPEGQGKLFVADDRR